MRNGGGICGWGLVGVICWVIGSGCSSARFTPTRPVAVARKGFFDRKNTVASASVAKSVVPAAVIHVSPHIDHPSFSGRSRTSGNSSPAKFSDFQWPLKQVEVTSVFGRRGKEFHEGVDLRARNGTPVYAARDGVVLYAESRIRGYGHMIVLRHAGKVNTIYAHNSKILVSRGQKIRQGEQIAVSGSSGHVTGPHVHFEIRNGIAAVNPLKYLPRSFASVKGRETRLSASN